MIEDAPEFYLVEGHASYEVWLPSIVGKPHLLTPAPRLAKAAYATAEEVRSGQLARATRALGGNPVLILDVPHASGPPLRAVRLFSANHIPPTAFPNAVTYLATTSRAPYTWIEDLNRGKPGYLLTGLPNAADLWEIVRCEFDPADRGVFVLSPVRLPHGLPTPDFTTIQNPLLRAEAQQHWRNLEQAVVAHDPYGLVNSAASLSEALLRAFLVHPGPPKTPLVDLLKRLLEEPNTVFSPLSYHFMQTFRLMHQSTQHPGRVVSTGRPVRPGLALTITEGMVEILTSIGLVQQGK
jgi:hypothetical protein